MPIPDATSGFRAFTREAALHLTVLSEYTYTLETLIQAGARRMAVQFVPIHTNAETRKSRLMRNLPSFMSMQAITITRFYTMYRPLRVFLSIGGLLIGLAVLIGLRFLYLDWQSGGRAGNIQSLILAAILSDRGLPDLLYRHGRRSGAHESQDVRGNPLPRAPHGARKSRHACP